MVVIAESYQLLNEHQWNNYLQIILDYALSDTPIYKFGKKEKMGRKNKSVI